MRRSQIAEDKDLLEVTMGVRKSAQDGLKNPRRLPLRCICMTTSHCAHCAIKTLRSLVLQTPSEFMCCTANGRPVTARALGTSFKEVARELQMKFRARDRVSAHSGRITGARLYSKLGVSENTIMGFGDWTNANKFRRYVGWWVFANQWPETSAAGLTTPKQQSPHHSALS